MKKIVCLFALMFSLLVFVGCGEQTTSASTVEETTTIIEETSVTIKPVCAHVWQLIDIMHPNCSHEGYHYFKCGLCGKTETRAWADRLEHDFEDRNASPCITNTACSMCGVSGEYEVNHKNTEVRGAKEPTCRDWGYGCGYTGDTYCLDCDRVIAKGENIPKLDHDLYFSAEYSTAIYYKCHNCEDQIRIKK